MFRKKAQPNREGKGQPQTPSEGDLFGVPLPEQPEYGDVFSSHVEFGAEFVPSDALPHRGRGLHPLPEIPVRTSRLPVHLSRLSKTQKILLLGIVMIAASLLYTFSATMGHRDQVGATSGGEQRAELPSMPGQPSPEAPRRPQPVWDTRGDGPRLGTSSPNQPETTEILELSIPSPEPLSLQLADKLYQKREYEHAFVAYDKLYRRLAATEGNRPLRDFLLLRMAMCSHHSGDASQADTLFRTVSLSRLPILRALARYHQSTILVERKRYLEAAARAYQTISLIGVADIDEKWVSAVRQQCGFLVAETVTRNLLSLSDADANLPSDLWGHHPHVDPFVNMDEPQLRVFLTSGSEKLDEAALSPQIRAATGMNAVDRWSVICNGASIEELLARFAANAGLNLRWADNGQTAPSEENMRKRPVYLYLTSATAQQVVTVAAGSVDLLAQLDASGRNVNVLDPTSYSSLAEHTRLLTEEAISLWQRFLLTADTDQRAPNGHFALGLLQTVRGQLDEAIAEYKLVANRFPKHPLAPHALLESGRLKVRLRDYVGAHADLKQLVEVYPETDLADTACLHLADATMKAGQYEEASGLYRKVYNLGLSVESQASSALGAGRCFHEMGNSEETARWLNRYVTLVRDQGRPEFHSACLLLGKAYLAQHKPQQAHAALNLAIKGNLSREQYVETVAVLVRAYIEQGLLLEALETIEGTAGWQLSQQESIDLLLLRVQILRSIGLVNKAIALLQEKGQFLPSPELKGAVALELAACYYDNDDIESARKTLSDAFALVGPGPQAQQIGRELARMCLRLGQMNQAISVCSQLLEHASARERPPVLTLLAEAHRRQGQYDRAMAAVLNQYDNTTDPNLVRVAPDAKLAP
ncbi:MAG TPA: tetratricopeptide repeat protein [Sedimentisphaerales bacterium]|nr:tetratricopeptide repeat protein [Sedimentisphaerales bacterium]HNU27776.1 tetratricopeptide repeat protein [Sedimentisphaerales bacterium]